METITIEEISGLPPECDGLAFEFMFDYIAPQFGGWDHPDEVEGVDIRHVDADGEDFTWLLNHHKRMLERVVLGAYKQEADDDFPM